MTENERVTQTMLSRKPREYSAQVAIISLLLVLWITLLSWKEGPEFSSRLAAIPEKVFQEKEYWRLWTAMAVHADLPTSPLTLFSSVSSAISSMAISDFGYIQYGVSCLQD